MAFLLGALTDPVPFGPFLALGLLITFVLRQGGWIG
jgi:prepilin signal peptidase PulO-like enzyme (type II secretory pathway)